jgi:hypothetical protein
MQNEPIEVMLLVTGLFERLGVPYLISGSLASTLYGMVRTTQNSDIIAEMHPEHIQPFVSALEADFYVDKEMIAEAIQDNSSFNIIHRDTIFKVDVFIPRPRPFLQSQLARATRLTFTLGTVVSAKFASPEDTILSKLEWYRMGSEVSDRQWQDILGVLKTKTGEINLEYLRQWAKELTVSDLLDSALTQSTS